MTKIRRQAATTSRMPDTVMAEISPGFTSLPKRSMRLLSWSTASRMASCTVSVFGVVGSSRDTTSITAAATMHRTNPFFCFDITTPLPLDTGGLSHPLLPGAALPAPSPDRCG